VKHLFYAATFVLLLFAGSGEAFCAETLTIATTGKGSAQNWPILIAKDEGFFAANNLSVDMIAAPSTANVIQELVAGSVDIGTGGLSDPIRAIDQGAPLSLLRVEALVPPYTLWAKRSIHSIKDLRHKLIIVGGIKDITRIYLQKMMNPNGLSDSDYDLIYAGTTVSRYSALLGGAVDAALLVPPFSFKAVDAKFSHLGDLSDYVTDLPFTGYAVQTNWAKTHKPMVMAFLKGVAKGVSWFYDPANRAAAISVLLKESGASPSDVQRTYAYYTKIQIFDRTGVVTPAKLASLTQAMRSLNDLDGSSDYHRFVDPQIAAMVAQVKP
jgi:NitT/TauT family transport system substrate-binding protein